MTGIGIGIGFGRSMAAEERKARSIPVPGAVVIAPLTQSWRNYGSAGGEFTRVGTPTLSSLGATFSGTGQCAYQVLSSFSASFSLTVRARLTELKTFSAIAAVYMQASGLTEYGWDVDQGSGTPQKFRIVANGIGYTDSGVLSDLVEHTFTLSRTGGLTSLYIDGTLRCSTATGSAGGTRLTLGSYTNSVNNCPVVERNATLYAPSLSDTDRALVEAWTAA